MTSESRHEIAQRLLREAVYTSRGRGASVAVLTPNTSGGCGLGKGPNLDLNWGARGDELAQQLWPAGLANSAAERVRDVLTSWIKRQDALDRKRNHFLKDFRSAHGFDGAAYTKEVAAQYEAGLEAVNALNLAEMSAAADALLEAAAADDADATR